MKVLQINVVYPSGSTGRITADIHHVLLERGIESYVSYGHGPRIEEPHVYRTRPNLEAKFWHALSLFTGNFYGGVPLGTHRVIRLIKKIRPDVVHLQCINGYFVHIARLMDYLKKNKIPTVLTLHADFMFTANCSYSDDCERWKTGCGHCPNLKQFAGPLCLDRTAHYWKMMWKALHDFNDLNVVAVSPWLQARAQQSPMLEHAHHSTIFNGIDTKVFHRVDTALLKEKLSLKDEKVVLYVSSVFGDPMKGGQTIVRIAEKLRDQNVKIVLVGAKKDQVFPNNIINVGRVTSKEEMARYYSLANVTVLTSKREAFSMVCAESLCAGTPVVGFLAGGPETISLKEYSAFVPYGDVDELTKTLKHWLAKSDLDRPALSKKAIAVYSKEKMAETYLALYQAKIK